MFYLRDSTPFILQGMFVQFFYRITFWVTVEEQTVLEKKQQRSKQLDFMYMNFNMYMYMYT